MELSDRAEEILETLWIETMKHKNAPDTTALKMNAAFRKLIEEGTTAYRQGGRRRQTLRKKTSSGRETSGGCLACQSRTGP